jgi:hypothetical protein
MTADPISPRTFDVRGWVANLVRCDELLVGETRYGADDTFEATYRCGERVVAVVVMRGTKLSPRSALWELSAQLSDRVERAMLPANARFVW